MDRAGCVIAPHSRSRTVRQLTPPPAARVRTRAGRRVAPPETIPPGESLEGST
ncbi:hypothetical protein GS506_17905 [Rhodococcus hoagii]|nr:hypothetical protein [Prescottella equi]